ncbi:MAG: NAD(P)-dependent oxidoreductase [Ruminococcus flavefaciens]|nr:NAD(P)-dependent oxidoreductase [Ruminococcus flavefaciens]
MTQTVLVTGGCSLIGQYICSGLIKKGYEVISADKEEGFYNMGKLHYTYIPWTPDDKEGFEKIFEKYEVNILIHTACTVDNDLAPIVTEKEVELSRKCDEYIYKTAMSSEKVRQVIIFSTEKVYAFPKSREPIREDADIKTTSNYAIMKYESEKALVSEMRNHKNVICCIARTAPVYSREFTDNLMAKITDPKDNTKFVLGTGQYGFQFCCIHNLVDFILCFVKNADDMSYAGNYNVADKTLTTAADIIAFMRKYHSLGTVIQKSAGNSPISKIKKIFKPDKDYKTNYRYLDMTKLENNNMLDTTKASKIVTFRWDINNTQ